MSSEKPQSKSEGYGFNEEWEAVGDLGELIGDAWLLPETILSDLLEGLFGGSSSN